MDTDGILHSGKVAWRSLANLQKELEQQKNEKNTKTNSRTKSGAKKGVNN